MNGAGDHSGDDQTVADTPSARGVAPAAGEADEIDETADIAAADRGVDSGTAVTAAPRGSSPDARTPLDLPYGEVASTLSLTTAADALRLEEVHRSRVFIRMGWLVSVGGIALTPFIDSARWIELLFIGVLVAGLVISFCFHQLWAKPIRYSQRQLLGLASLCIVNAHISVLYLGAFTAASLIVVLGLYFASRTEGELAAKVIYAECAVLYAAVALPIVAGWIPDPGGFASDRPYDPLELGIGALFVEGVYFLAYWFARTERQVSLDSIEDLQKATRQASQREALLHELRQDLDRALQIGGPGRYTEQVVGSFVLGAVIGRGAMGEVYEATNEDTHQLAAVKLLHRELLAESNYVERFFREAKAAAALDSPHVVEILEASEHDAPLPFLAMERLHGATLSQLLRRSSQLSETELLQMVDQVTIGVDAAAAAEIVHRDLKPQNLFLTTDSVWKILDFGVATLGESSGTLTAGGVVGTPTYMAPEQARGERVDHRADLYALAAIVYRCVTGRRMFSGTDTPSLLYKVVHRMPPRPGSLVALPDDVDRFLAIGVAKRKQDRFDTGAQIRETLELAMRDELPDAMRRRADALIKKFEWDDRA